MGQPYLHIAYAGSASYLVVQFNDFLQWAFLTNAILWPPIDLQGWSDMCMPSTQSSLR